MFMFDGRTTLFRACVVWYGHVVLRAFFQFSPKSGHFSEFVQLSTVSVWIFIKNRPGSFQKHLILRSLTFGKTLINESLLIEINWNLSVDLTRKVQWSKNWLAYFFSFFHKLMDDLPLYFEVNVLCWVVWSCHIRNFFHF